MLPEPPDTIGYFVGTSHWLSENSCQLMDNPVADCGDVCLWILLATRFSFQQDRVGLLHRLSRLGYRFRSMVIGRHSRL